MQHCPSICQAHPHDIQGRGGGYALNGRTPAKPAMTTAIPTTFNVFDYMDYHCRLPV
jgi:hypothetical protein